MKQLASIIGALALAALMIVGRPSTISAHSEYDHSEPADGATVATAPNFPAAIASRWARNALRNPSRSNSSTRSRCCWRHTTTASAITATMPINPSNMPSPYKPKCFACSLCPNRGREVCNFCGL